MNNHNNHHYNKNLKLMARHLRTESVSRAEKRIWKRLLSRRQMGIRFLRQRPIDKYIVDFFAPEIGLIIEVNGSSHLISGENDALKRKQMEAFGYDVLYLSEGTVLNNLDEVQKIISHAIHCKMHDIDS
ncbi:MAG: endonuclease domain-containing protein [Fluviicola sp.]